MTRDQKITLLRGGRRERGQALVETALSMMILIILLAGMVDLGLAFGHRVAVASASRTGARYGSRFPHRQSLIERAAVDALRGTLVLADDDTLVYPDDTGTVEIVIGCENGGNPVLCTEAQREAGDQIRVTVTVEYSPLFGGLLGIGDLTIGSATLMGVLGIDAP